MRIAESQLRKIIRNQILSLLKEEGEVNTGKDIKGTAASDKATEKVTSSPAIKVALDAIKTPDGLASFLQDVTDAIAEKGMDQSKVASAIKKFGREVLAAKKQP
jgi:hypothetical protein